MYHTHKSNTRKLAEIVAGLVAMVVLIDALGFMAWIASGQTPADGFYIGSLTAHALRALLF